MDLPRKITKFSNFCDDRIVIERLCTFLLLFRGLPFVLCLYRNFLNDIVCQRQLLWAFLKLSGREVLKNTSSNVRKKLYFHQNLFVLIQHDLYHLTNVLITWIFDAAPE